MWHHFNSLNSLIIRRSNELVHHHTVGVIFQSLSLYDGQSLVVDWQLFALSLHKTNNEYTT